MADFDVAQRIPKDAAKTLVDTVNLRTIPIIFIPGVMGSRLLMPGFNDWDPDNPGTMLLWANSAASQRAANLGVITRPVADVSGIPSSAMDADIAKNTELQDIAAAHQDDARVLFSFRGWAGVSWGFYGKVLTFLETTFNFDATSSPVYAFGYDWRQSNFTSGSNLLAFIVKVLGQHPGASQVILVTHSMGGIVARAALALNPSVVSSIRGVVHGAQPSVGAVVAYRRFFTGATPPFDGSGVADRVLGTIMGTTPREYATILSDLPGPMQLMPSHLYPSPANDPWLKTSPQVDLTNPATVYALPLGPGILLNPIGAPDPFVVGFINTALLAQVAQHDFFHRTLGDVGHPNTHVLSSTGLKTDVQVDFTGTNAAKVITKAAGDGTVPQVSGACPGIRASFVKSRDTVSGIEHSKVYSDDAFNKKVEKVIRLILS